MAEAITLHITDVETGAVMVLYVQADEEKLESIIRAYRETPGLKLSAPVNAQVA